MSKNSYSNETRINERVGSLTLNGGHKMVPFICLLFFFNLFLSKSFSNLLSNYSKVSFSGHHIHKDIIHSLSFGKTRILLRKTGFYFLFFINQVQKGRKNP